MLCISSSATGGAASRAAVCGDAEGGRFGAAAEGCHHVCVGMHPHQPGGGTGTDWTPSQRIGGHGCARAVHGVRRQVRAHADMNRPR